jgi:hypothetical protein
MFFENSGLLEGKSTACKLQSPYDSGLYQTNFVNQLFRKTQTASESPSRLLDLPLAFYTLRLHGSCFTRNLFGPRD